MPYRKVYPSIAPKPKCRPSVRKFRHTQWIERNSLGYIPAYRSVYLYTLFDNSLYFRIQTVQVSTQMYS